MSTPKLSDGEALGVVQSFTQATGTPVGSGEDNLSVGGSIYEGDSDDARADGGAAAAAPPEARAPAAPDSGGPGQ